MTQPSSSPHATQLPPPENSAAKISIWRMTTSEWLICAVACIGFAFDTYVLLVFTLIVRPALLEMLPPTAGPALFNRWVGLLFYVPAIAGGVFGLLGGYLIDLLGRRRILLWSILLYGACTFASAYVTSPAQFLFAALRNLRRRLGRVRRRHGVAGRAIHAPRTPRSRHRIYARLLLYRRLADQRRLLHRRHLQPAPAFDPRRPRCLALYRLVRIDSRHSPDRAAAVSAGIADLEAKEGRGNAEAAQLRRTLPSRISQDRARSPA